MEQKLYPTLFNFYFLYEFTPRISSQGVAIMGQDGDLILRSYFDKLLQQRLFVNGRFPVQYSNVHTMPGKLFNRSKAKAARTADNNCPQPLKLRVCTHPLFFLNFYSLDLS